MLSIKYPISKIPPTIDCENLPFEAQEDFKTAMRLMASTVAVITTESEGVRYGLTATAVCSLAMEPPMLLICVDRKSKSHPAIHGAGRFCVNLLADNQLAVAAAFSNSKIASEEKFGSAGQWQRGQSGSPVLGNAVANVECATVEAIEAATHTIFIGSVLRVKTDEARGPLLYANRSFGSILPSA